jgi:uncharacterized protein (DUF1800 family)
MRRIGLVIALSSSVAPVFAAPAPPAWQQAGLSPTEAARHLLDRFSYGPRPGEVEAVAALGPELWLERQLRADLAETTLALDLSRYDALALSGPEIAARYPSPGMILIRARAAGVVDQDGDPADPATRRTIRRWASEQGYRSQRELTDQVRAQKLSRAVLAENQLHEVLTDFWANHFTVSGADPETRAWVLAYERDAIRPRALGSFADLLGASARHPAMLLYLDNARSTAADGTRTTLEATTSGRTLERGGFDRGRGGMAGRGGRGGGRFGGSGFGGGATFGDRRGREPGRPGSQQGDRRPRGLNENYARELLELHTLGVDGGYTQQDVVEVARAFTGWSVVPPELGDRGRSRDLDRARRFGFEISEDGFLFRADAHDAEPKTVLGRRLPAGRGLADGEEVLTLLAAHPATATHVATKFARRFVADQPSPALIATLAATFTSSGGDTRALIRRLVAEPEFWSQRGAKIKSPFELVVSSLRASAAAVTDLAAAVAWVERMGQPLYAAAAPTGFPEVGEAWVSAGALLSRMHFAVALAGGAIDGVEVAHGALGPPDASAAQLLDGALRTLLPGRPTAALIEQLLPAAEDPDLAARVVAADVSSAMAPPDDELDAPRVPAPRTPPAALDAQAQVLAVVIGSPEFQRR